MAFVVSEAEHSRFRRAGNDLSIVVSCGPLELLLAGERCELRRDRVACGLVPSQAVTCRVSRVSCRLQARATRSSSSIAVA